MATDENDYFLVRVHIYLKGILLSENLYTCMYI